MFYTVKTYGFLYLAVEPSVDRTLPGLFSPGSTKNDTFKSSPSVNETLPG